MKSLAVLPAEERALYWRSYSERKGVPAFIVEKDFWVCWLLGRIFATPPLVAEMSPDAFDDFRAEVVALEIERTFWEKATILHAEYHRPVSQPIRDRFARHYSDFAALWNHPGGRAAATRLDLLQRVRLHKGRHFGSGWAHYESAVPGTLRLAPPASRLAELRRDDAAMEPMFLAAPPAFEEMVVVLHDAEKTLNAS